MSRLKDKFKNSREVLKLLHDRYGLNLLGVKRLLDINGTRYNQINNGAEFTELEKQVITTTFQELKGRI